MPSKPILSEEDKGNIKQELQNLCEKFWVKKGYKKTSIKELCASAHIAIGTFYSLFATKEDLFFETARDIQIRLSEQFRQTLQQGKDRESLAKALKELFREYDSKPFLYDVNTPDFRAFVTKLSEEVMKELRYDTISFFKEVCHITNLRPKIDEELACGVLNALLSTIGNNQTLS